MGQAKLRGTREERVAIAQQLPPKPRKFSNREIRLMAHRAAIEIVEKSLGPLFKQR